MASVTLTKLYVHDYADVTDYDSFAYAGFSESTRKVGRVRRLAGGRLVLRTEPGTEGRHRIDFTNLTGDEVELLRARIGTHVVVRDMRGRLIYGTYFDVDVDDRPENDYRNAQIMVETVTGTAEV